VSHSIGPPQTTPQSVNLSQSAVQRQFPNEHVPAIASLLKPNPPQLTSHSLALLNAFKNSRDSRTTTRSPIHASGLIDAVPNPLAHMQELSADESQSEKPVGLDNGPFISVSPLLPARQQATDDHRSSLLSLFKISNSKTSYADPAATITTPADIQRGSGATSSRLPSVDPFLDAAPDQMRNGVEGASSPRFQNSESVTPFRPTSILARPSQISSQASNNSRSAAARSDDPIIALLNRKGISAGQGANILDTSKENAGPAKIFQPQILKRPQPVAEAMPAELAAPSPTFSMPSAFERRSSQSTEHKQNLLSLLRQGSVASLSPVPEQKNITDTPLLPFGALSDTLNRSRVNSVVSAGADIWLEPSSRRSSRTPISAADKGFLFGFLESMNKAKES